MKIIKLLFTGCVAVFIAACTNDRKQATDSTDSVKAILDTTQNNIDVLSDIPWTAEMDSVSEKYTMKRSPIYSSEILTKDNVIESINRKYPENKLVWEGLKNDTAYVKIENSDYLTQSSGSTGARIFLAESTYSLTELPHVNVVYFDFTVGDHATPGPYTRTSFDFSMPKNNR